MSEKKDIGTPSTIQDGIESRGLSLYSSDMNQVVDILRDERIDNKTREAAIKIAIDKLLYSEAGKFNQEQVIDYLDKFREINSQITEEAVYDALGMIFADWPDMASDEHSGYPEPGYLNKDKFKETFGFDLEEKKAKEAQAFAITYMISNQHDFQKAKSYMHKWGLTDRVSEILDNAQANMLADKDRHPDLASDANKLSELWKEVRDYEGKK